MKIWIDWNDGRFSYRTEPGIGAGPVEVPALTLEMFKHISALDAHMQQQLGDLENQLLDHPKKKVPG